VIPTCPACNGEGGHRGQGVCTECEGTGQYSEVRAAIANFPGEFGLRAFPGRRFAISKSASFYDGHGVQPVVVLVQPDGSRSDWARGGVGELLLEITQ
jgi:hypothetical protein